MAYFKYKDKKYDDWSSLKEAVKKNPSTSPVIFQKGRMRRRIATAPKTSALNFLNDD